MCAAYFHNRDSLFTFRDESFVKIILEMVNHTNIVWKTQTKLILWKFCWKCRSWRQASLSTLPSQIQMSKQSCRSSTNISITIWLLTDLAPSVPPNPLILLSAGPQSSPHQSLELHTLHSLQYTLHTGQTGEKYKRTKRRTRNCYTQCVL